MLSRSLLLPPLALVLSAPAHAQSESPDATGVLPLASASVQPLEPWVRELETHVVQSEYLYSRAGEFYTAPNLAQGLRSRIGDAGIDVLPREVPQGNGAQGNGASPLNAAETPWQFSLRTVGFGYEGDVRALGASRLEGDGNRIVRQWEQLVEWFVNDARGIEHGWTVPAAPRGAVGRRLHIDLESAGLAPQVAADGLSAVFLDAGSETRLRYHGLAAWDASGRELAARLMAVDGGLRVEVDARNALYPVTVDPILSGAVWVVDSGQMNARFGTSASGAGDVNGDGYHDVVVGAPLYDNGQNDEGRAYLYFGSATGPATSPDWTAEGDQVNAQFGVSVSGAGDVNGDGFDDVIVGAYGFDNGQADEGQAFLYLGSAKGPSVSADWSADGNQEGALLGHSVSGAGDVNGDGFDDVIVGAYGFDNGEVDEGRAYVYFGGPTGPSAAPDWSAESDQAGALFGYSVSGAGDVNGDGFDDILVGAHGLDNGEVDEGRAYLYLGGSTGPSATPDWSAESDQAGALFGVSVAGAGDLNGDGFDDVIIGAQHFNGGEVAEGKAYVFLGSATGPSATPDWTAESDHVAARFGCSVAGAGDVNRDGFDDVIVGAYFFINAPVHGDGAAFLYLGSTAGLSTIPDWMGRGLVGLWEFYGNSVAAAGDVNGDGKDDVLVGAWNRTEQGGAYLYLGQADCNGNDVDDDADISGGASLDCNGNSVPDECDLASQASLDCNANGLPDECDIASATSSDCNQNTVPDECDLASQASLDCNANGLPDECDIASATSPDCNQNAVPDECDLASSASQDCNANGLPDECDIAGGVLDGNWNGVPDGCESDCNKNGILDVLDIAAATSEDANGNGQPDECEHTKYCSGKRNSLDLVPRIDATGCPSLTGPDDFYVTADRVVPQTTGFLIWSFFPSPYKQPGSGLITIGASPPGAKYCVLTPMAVGHQISAQPGVLVFHVSQAFMAANGFAVGTDVYVQWIYRDPTHPDGSAIGHTRALHFQVL